MKRETYINNESNEHRRRKEMTENACTSVNKTCITPVHKVIKVPYTERQISSTYRLKRREKKTPPITKTTLPTQRQWQRVKRGNNKRKRIKVTI